MIAPSLQTEGKSLQRAQQFFRLQVAELAKKRPDAARYDKSFHRLVVLMKRQLAAAQQHFAEGHVGIGA